LWNFETFLVGFFDAMVFSLVRIARTGSRPAYVQFPRQCKSLEYGPLSSPGSLTV
jgi:hypothetical protein